MEKDDKFGRTPCLFVIINGRIDVIQFLLSTGAEKERADEEGRTMTDLAMASERARGGCRNLIFLPQKSSRQYLCGDLLCLCSQG
jgi:ankyrin repeat protein